MCNLNPNNASTTSITELDIIVKKILAKKNPSPNLNPFVNSSIYKNPPIMIITKKEIF